MLLYGDLAVRHRVLSRRQPRHWCSALLSTSQFVSLILVPLAIVMLVVLGRRRMPTRQAAAQRAAA